MEVIRLLLTLKHNTHIYISSNCPNTVDVVDGIQYFGNHYSDVPDPP